ncbi:DNA-binding response regulator, partial [Rhizobium ruizarguesonis]
MFMTGSGMENADQGRKLSQSGDTILVVAKADLFSECMVEALAKKFPNCEVASITSTKPMLEKDTSD